MTEGESQTVRGNVAPSYSSARKTSIAYLLQENYRRENNHCAALAPSRLCEKTGGEKTSEEKTSEEKIGEEKIGEEKTIVAQP
jgi:hypothetical protein